MALGSQFSYIRVLPYVCACFKAQFGLQHCGIFPCWMELRGQWSPTLWFQDCRRSTRRALNHYSGIRDDYRWFSQNQLFQWSSVTSWVLRCRGPTASDVLLVMLLNWTVPLDVLVSTLDSSVCLKAWISRLDQWCLRRERMVVGSAI